MFATIGLISAVCAGELEQVRVFVGENHAQVLLVSDEPVRPTIQTTARMGDVPARASVSLPRTEIDDQLASAYAKIGERWIVPVGSGGVLQIAITDLGDSLQVSVETQQEREASFEMVGESGILVNLKVPGAPDDASLPKASLLATWMEGGSLSRQSQDISQDKRLVVVDAGHGGWDRGAIGLTGTEEADIALAISRRVAAQLEQELNVQVVMTRETDVFIPLKDRASMANALDADLFLSIHANAAPGPTAWGIATFYMDTATDKGAARVASRENAVMREAAVPMDSLMAELAVSGAKQASRELAGLIQTEVVAQLSAAFGEEQIRDLGVKSALFYVLVYTEMPSILYESNFLTHPEDETRLRLPAFQQITAEAITAAVELYFESTGGQ